jgi:hypothetical protein
MVEASMSTTPRELLDTSIAQLELLRAFLGEQLGVRTDKSESTATSDLIACQEILVSLGALILRVQATSPESGDLIGLEFLAGTSGGKRSLTIRDMQHEYIFVEN